MSAGGTTLQGEFRRRIRAGETLIAYAAAANQVAGDGVPGGP